MAMSNAVLINGKAFWPSDEADVERLHLAVNEASKVEQSTEEAELDCPYSVYDNAVLIDGKVFWPDNEEDLPQLRLAARKAAEAEAECEMPEFTEEDYEFSLAQLAMKNSEVGDCVMPEFTEEEARQDYEYSLAQLALKNSEEEDDCVMPEFTEEESRQDYEYSLAQLALRHPEQFGQTTTHQSHRQSEEEINADFEFALALHMQENA